MKRLFLFSLLLIFSLTLISAPFGYNNRDLVILRDGSLNDLTDVSVPSPTNNYVLTYNSTSGQWYDASAAAVGDTNETTRFNTLVGTDCTGTDKVIGVNNDGSLLCGADNNTGGAGGGNTSEEMQDAVGGAFNITLIYDDTGNEIGVNKTWLDSLYQAVGSYLTSAVELLTNTDQYITLNDSSGSVLIGLNETTLNASIDARAPAGADNSSWNESYANTLYYALSNPYSYYNSTNPPALDEIGNPSTDTSFSMANNQLLFTYQAPTPSDGAFEIEATGAFTGDLVHIHQHTGAPGAGTELLHLENANTNVLPLNISTASDVAMWTDKNITAGGFSGTLSCTDITGADTDFCNDATGAGGKYGGTPYLYNDSASIYVNDTYLNLTIDDRDAEDNSSWNETWADTQYADISVTGDNSTWNQTHANTLYYSLSNPYSYWNDTFATFNKTYADTLYYGIGNPSNFVTNLTMNKTVNCNDIVGSPDSDFCTDDDSGGDGYNTTEEMQDAVGGAFNITLNYDDAGDEIGVNQTWLTSFIESVITSFVDSAFIQALGFYTDTETDTEIQNANTSMKTYADATFLTSYTETDPLWESNFTAHNSSWSLDTDTNLTEDDVEAYIFDNDNTDNLNMSEYNITDISNAIYTNGTASSDWRMYVNGTGWFIIEEV